MPTQNMTRSHTCGELRATDVEREVTLCGWVSRRRNHGGLIFLDLRDRFGTTQVVFAPPAAEAAPKTHAYSQAIHLRSEFVIGCKGRVYLRPEGMENTQLDTGAIEVKCHELIVFSEAKTPPFPIEDGTDTVEALRLKYRYLDLRRPSLQKNLQIRHQALSIVRQELDQQGFVEVDTPILYKATPEGARDFLVPSSSHPGYFYALPQSPQTLKQLLMIAGMDRYYQIARCFRDEALRADRQLEFSQIDIEASFIDQETLFTSVEAMMVRLWKEILQEDVPTPFPKMHYTEAMNRFGSDKPDVRFGLELVDLSSIFQNSSFQVFRQALSSQKGSIRGIRVPEKADSFSRKDLEQLQEQGTYFGAKGLLWMKVLPDGELQSPAAKFFSETEKAQLILQLGLQTGDLVLMVADAINKVVFDALGAIRLNIGHRLGLIPPPGEGKPAFLWVVQFPLLEWNEQDQRFYACHHPFTSPSPEWKEDFLAGKNLDQIEASAYDLVMNGMELGGGSLRIYQPEVQAAMFRALGMSQQEAETQFGFFLEALQFGTPPHGGIALGVERVVASLCKAGPIRDVIAFPKTQKGFCLMSETPTPLTPSQLQELGLALFQVDSAH